MNYERGSNNQLPAMFVIFGGTGDLAARKLLPALYNLFCDGLLPERFAVAAVGRKSKSIAQYRQEVFAAVSSYSRIAVTAQKWRLFERLIYYVELDFMQPDSYFKLNAFLNKLDNERQTCGNRIFYLAVAPEYFEPIVQGLQQAAMTRFADGWKRLVIEKPFGRDLKSAARLNGTLSEVFHEQNIYRIDHYLGKEMIQNIMVLRFCNPVFEAVWSNKYIDHVQILLSEQAGIGSRGGYYETAGAMRDMVQNHVLQTLSLIAMEPPVHLQPDDIRTEKIKVVQAIEPFTAASIADGVVFGQYGAGIVKGSTVLPYRSEQQVDDCSDTETFVAMKLHIQNFRWAGTPFYVRTGKRLGIGEAKIVIQFKQLPPILYFRNQAAQQPNVLVIKIQPEVGVCFEFSTKKFGSQLELVQARMDTSNASYANGNTPEAYERLIVDVLRGDTTLFSRWDEVEASWKLVDDIIGSDHRHQFAFPNYAAGSMGPADADRLIEQDGRKWWD